MSESVATLSWFVHQFLGIDFGRIVGNFDIPEENVLDLAMIVIRAKGKPRDRKKIIDRGLAECEKRIDTFTTALKLAAAIHDFYCFVPMENGMKLSVDPRKMPKPPEYVEPPNLTDPFMHTRISISKFRELLAAVIESDKRSLASFENALRDWKALGNNVDRQRHAFWFELLVYWYHDLGRPITTSIDPVTGRAFGKLIDFVAIMSETVLDPMPSAHAIRSFIRNNKARVVTNPGFGRPF